MSTSALQGRVALVTGAARGVGREVALGLAEAGADLVLIDRCRPLESTAYAMASPRQLKAVCAEITTMGRRCLAFECDVADLRAMVSTVDASVDALGSLDIVVANAGIFTWGRLWELTERQWDETIAVNLKGTWITLKATVPHLISEDGVGSSASARLQGCAASRTSRTMPRPSMA